MGPAILNHQNHLNEPEKFPAELAIEAAQIGTFELGHADKSFFYSKRLLEIFGFSPFQKLSNEDFRNLVHPKDRPIRDKAHKKCLKTGFLVYEVRITRKDKSIRWIQVNARVYDQDSIFPKLYGTVIDITFQKNREFKLKESENQLLNLANSIPQLAWTADSKGEIYWYNQQWYDYTGTTLETMKGWGWQSVHHPDLVEEVTARFKKAVREGIPYEQTFLLRGKDMQYRWFLTRAVPLMDENKNVKQWFGTNTDVNEFQKEINSLKNTDQNLLILNQNLPNLVWVGDPSGNIIYLSENWKELGYLSPFEFKNWKSIVHPDDFKSFNETFKNCIANGKSYSIEFRLKNKRSEYHWHLGKVSPVINSKEEIIKYIGSIINIHHQKTQELKKDEVIQVAGHEIKNPLTAAIAYLQMLELSLDKNGLNYKYAQKAFESVQRINKLISDLLDSRLREDRNINFNLKAFNMEALILKTIESLEINYPSYKIEFTGKIKKEFLGDEDKIQQVLINLLQNAIKYSPNSYQIYIQLKEDLLSIFISIQDFGIGIPIKHLEKVFERYYRSDEHSSRFQGSGIGLFVAKDIVENHHGKIWVESTLGKGSIFYISLPKI